MTTLVTKAEPRVAANAVDAVKIYGGGATEVRALDGISIAFAEHSFTAIMGPSGSGKSTLLHCLAGLDTLTSGQAFIGADDLSLLDDRKLTVLRRDRLGFVFQAYNLVPTLTAAENIALPLRLAGRRPDRNWLATVIDTLGLADRLAHRPAELSSGQHNDNTYTNLMARRNLRNAARVLRDLRELCEIMRYCTRSSGMSSATEAGGHGAGCASEVTVSHSRPTLGHRAQRPHRQG